MLAEDVIDDTVFFFADLNFLGFQSLYVLFRHEISQFVDDIRTLSWLLKIYPPKVHALRSRLTCSLIQSIVHGG